MMLQEVLRCPRCGSAFTAADSCRTCGAVWQRTTDGIPMFTQEAIDFDPAIDANLAEVAATLETAGSAVEAEAVLLDVLEERGLGDRGNPVWLGRSDVLRLMSERIHPFSPRLALDVGCGLGTLTSGLARWSDHVIAIDRSSSRAKFTQARMRAEQLDNVTVAVADHQSLPVERGSVDLANVVGVLEWLPVSQAGRPRSVQLEFLRRLHEALSDNGLLLLGIENRVGIHYWMGAREEHSGLRFASLLPRSIGSWYGRIRTGRPYRTWTYSLAGLSKLLTEAKLRVLDVYVPLPSYSNPRLVIPVHPEFRGGLRFYFEHVYRETTLARRLLARIGKRVGSVGLAPCFMVIAGKEDCRVTVRPLRALAVMGNPRASESIKLVDLLGSEPSRVRLSSRREPKMSVESRAWENGPTLRRGIQRPFRERRRVSTAASACEAILETYLIPRLGEPAGDDLPEFRVEVEKGAKHLRVPSANARTLADVAVGSIRMAREHGDLTPGNVVIRDGVVFPIDSDSGGIAIAGRDLIQLLLTTTGDLFGIEDGLLCECAMRIPMNPEWAAAVRRITGRYLAVAAIRPEAWPLVAAGQICRAAAHRPPVGAARRDQAKLVEVLCSDGLPWVQ